MSGPDGKSSGFFLSDFWFAFIKFGNPGTNLLDSIQPFDSYNRTHYAYTLAHT
jgi:hypothetical protein